MSKRVHEIAKEHDLTPSEVLDRLRSAGMELKSVSSGVDESAALKALGLAGGNGGSASAKRPAAARGAAPAKPAASASAPAKAAPAAKTTAAAKAAPAAKSAPAAPSASAAPSAPAPASTPAPAASPSGESAAAKPKLRRVTISGPGGGDRARSGSAPARGAAPRSGSPESRPVMSPSEIARAAQAPVGGDPRRGAPADPRRAAASDPRRVGMAPADPRRTQPQRDPRRVQGTRRFPQNEGPQAQAAAAPPPAPVPLDIPRSISPMGNTGRGTMPQADTRRGGPRGGRAGGPGGGAGPRQPLVDPRSGSRGPVPSDPRGGSRGPVPSDPRRGAPNARVQQPGAAGAPGAPGTPPPAAGDAAQGENRRPTRDSLQGERSPGAAPGGRRRVVIDSQAARRGPGGPGGPGGGPPGANQPPRRQRRGRRRRGVYDDAVESQATNALTADMPKDLVRINSGSTASDVAEYLNVSVAAVMTKLIQLGELRTVTQTLPDETIEVLAGEFERDVEIVHSEDEVVAEPVYDDAEEDLVDRPPVVTIMGHVDHGKTSLLDAIRQTEVAAGEAGGITQHIGAYQVHHDGKTITFLDTPGHEAFTAMRARGARVTDLAVIVVAADDGVKPQTQEAVDHAKEAGVPILVAVNKIDKEGADPVRVRTEMTAIQLQPVEWGGETEFVDVSARTKVGLDTLLETILVMAEVEELKANPNVEASGTVVESKLDPGRGPVVTILIDRGTLKVGDALVAGAHWGRVRAMNDFNGVRTTSAGPGDPVEVLGFDGVPAAGEHIRVVENERRARQLAAERATRLKTESLARRSNKRISLEDIAGGQLNELNLLVKADVAGSLEAIQDEIAKLPQQEVAVNVIRSAVGAVTESDVMLAAASDAVVLAFNVRPVGDARSAADREGVEIRSYSVIYRAVEDLRQAMQGMLAPEEVEEALGSAEVRQTFRASRIGTIAGSYITEGKITRGAKVRLVRDGTVVYTGEIASLRRFNEDAREVAAGFECGIVLNNYADVKEGDVLEAYATRQVERELVS